ncbi:hypothetical protein [Sphingobacterium paludis]|uniref:Uncharacterized protein n=1 Tax=Sphingobacterium paludis TaxID=1476465 RepID=A0A4R7CTG9_9SPHI|nr:hypothetical protein [Sphingobacterium paludis]TDS11703.1 hypothetical protein B0I21_10744 [Sphingobacterium paludis]
MNKLSGRFYVILITEWIGVNESLSFESRYKVLKATIGILINDMPLEDIWRFYRKREMFYGSLRLLTMFSLLMFLFQLYNDFYSYFFQLSPLLVTSYVCTLPILRPGYRYSDIWEDKSEFLNLVRSKDIEDYKMQKDNFWNYKNINAEERVLTLHNHFNFDIMVVQTPQRRRNPEYDRFFRKVEAGRFFHGIPPEEYFDISKDFVFILKSKIDGQEYSFSYDTIFNKIKSDVVQSLNAEKGKKAYLDPSLSFDARIQSLMCCENSFNLLPMRSVILFFDPLRLRSDCDPKLKKFGLTDEQFITFIVSRFVEKDGVDLNLSLNKDANKGFAATFFHHFYVYSTKTTGEPKRNGLKKYYILLSSTFCEFKKEKTDNFASTDLELIGNHESYQKSVEI